MNHLDTIVNQVFAKEMQQKRVKKEIQSLKDLDSFDYHVSLQTSSQGLKVLIEVCEGALISKMLKINRIQFPIIFEFLMDQNFPFNPPKIFAKTHFFKPSLADGRDYYNEVVQKKWNPAIPLIDIINLLPNFLKKIEDLPKSENSQLFGEFHLGMLYSLEDFMSLENISLFPGEEILSDQKGTSVERFFVINESFFLSFEPVDKSKNTIRLIAWAHVQSIANVKRSKENMKKLVVTWINKNSKSGVIQNTYLVDNSQLLLEAMVHSSQKYGVKVSKGQQKKDLTIAEVTIKSYQDMDIEELLDNITFLESQLDIAITIDVVNLLMTLYQKAVEYFSAFNDTAYQDFMLRLHSLLQREDVQVVLQSREEENLKPKSQENIENGNLQEQARAEKKEIEEEKKEEIPTQKNQETPNKEISILKEDTRTQESGEKKEIKEEIKEPNETQERKEEDIEKEEKGNSNDNEITHKTQEPESKQELQNESQETENKNQENE